MFTVTLEDCTVPEGMDEGEAQATLDFTLAWLELQIPNLFSLSGAKATVAKRWVVAIANQELASPTELISGGTSGSEQIGPFRIDGSSTAVNSMVRNLKKLCGVNSGGGIKVTVGKTDTFRDGVYREGRVWRVMR